MFYNNRKVKEVHDLDLDKPYGVFLRGSQVGSGRNVYIDRKTRAKLVATYDDEKGAKDRVNEANRRLSPGEKKYHQMKYVAIKMSKAKVAKA